MINKKLNVALVGCGFIGQYHVDALLKLNNLYNLKIIYENKKENIKKIKPSKKTLIKKEFSLKNIPNDLDIIVITAPTHLHNNLANIALKKVKTVIVEKPLGLNLIPTKKIVNKFRKSNKNIVVVKQLRMHPYFFLLKKLIEKKFFKRIYFLNLNIFLNRSKKYFTSSNWKGKKILDGGTLFNQISHYVDLLVWIFGKTTNESGLKVSNGKKNNEFSGACTFLLKNKILSSLNYTIKSYETNFENSLNLVSEIGNFSISPEKFIAKNLNKSLKKDFNKEVQKSKNALKKFEKGFEVFYKNVHNVLCKKKNTKNLVSLNDDAFRSFENLIRINNKMKEVLYD